MLFVQIVNVYTSQRPCFVSRFELLQTNPLMVISVAPYVPWFLGPQIQLGNSWEPPVTYTGGAQAPNPTDKTSIC